MNERKGNRRKQIILLLIILFGIVAFAGGSKLTNRESTSSGDATAAEATSSASVSPAANSSVSPTAIAASSFLTSTPMPGQSATPEQQALSAVSSDDTTPKPTATPTSNPTSNPTAHPTSQPTPTPSPIIQNSGVQGRMMRTGDCGAYPGTCLPTAYQGVASLYRSSGNEFIKQVSASSDGSFWVILNPGTYYFIHNGSPSLDKTEFTVPTNSFVTVTLSFK